MNNQPEHIIRKGKKSWEVLGTLPPTMKGAGRNDYRTFISLVKKALNQIPENDLARLPLVQLQKNDRVKGLYERYFKGNPDLLNSNSVTSLVASALLNYSNDTGAVRDSLADVKKQRQLPTTTAPSLQLRKEHEFDRTLLLLFHRFTVEKGIPESFLHSNYFTMRPQLLQLFQENPLIDFRVRLEQASGNIEDGIWQDYKMLVNETNRMYLARYPFADIARQTLPTTSDFSAAANKLDEIHRLNLTIMGSNQKFVGIDEMSQTYSHTPESKIINPKHFLKGLQGHLRDDQFFTETVLRNRSRVFQRVQAVLQGKSL